MKNKKTKNPQGDSKNRFILPISTLLVVIGLAGAVFYFSRSSTVVPQTIKTGETPEAFIVPNGVTSEQVDSTLTIGERKDLRMI